MAIATVREWHDEEGWGVLDCPETPGGCWAWYAAIEMEGFRTLATVLFTPSLQAVRRGSGTRHPAHNAIVSDPSCGATASL